MSEARLDDVAIDDLVSQYLAQRRRGERLSVDEFARRYPHWEADIRRLLPAALALERFKAARQSSSGSGNGERPAPLDQTRLGDYVLLEEIGHGGMGVVYKARQTSLGRIVAVKVLRAGAVAGSKQQKRFERESQAAARLHHTNIVPVFGVGLQDGIHYYVMQFIEGEGLDDVIAELARIESGAPPTQRTNSAETCAEKSRPTASDVVRVLLGSGRPSTPAAGNSTVVSRPVASASTSHGSTGGDRSAIEEGSSRESASPAPPDAEDAPPERRGGERFSLPRAAGRGETLSGRHYWRSVARIGLEAAHALEYAHSQGTLHRDVKPGNLIVDKRGSAWITDFGLAKLTHNESLTETGDVVGTLRYMAPEQFSGGADARSDIYGLGVTLYELATLRPAFDATGRAGLIDQILRQEPVRPRRLRPSIPRDLETIILKAISREPNHRYQSAAEMAADLERLLDDRPVKARRVGPVERLWRWCRRNPATALPTAAAAALLVLACSVATGAYIRESSLRETAEFQKNRAEENVSLLDEQRRRADENTLKALAEQQQTRKQKRRAEANLALALQAFEEVFERIAPTIQHSPDEDAGDENLEPEYQVVVSPKDTALLESMLTFYDRFADQNSTNVKLQSEAARAHRRVGDIHQRLGQFEEAETAYRHSLALYERLAAGNPDQRSFRIANAVVLNELGLVRKMMGRRDEAEHAHREALGILSTQHQKFPAEAAITLEMVRTYNLLGRSVWGRHWHDPNGDVHLVTQAEDNYRKAVALIEKLVAAEPMNPEYQLTLARSYRDLSPVLLPHESNRRSSNKSAHDKPIEPDPVVEELNEKKRNDAVEFTRNAIDILERLVAVYPTVPLYRYELVHTLSDHEPRLWGELGLEEGRRRFDRAIELADELARDFPTVPAYAQRYAYTWAKYGSVLDDAGLIGEAECMRRECVELRRLNVERFPEIGNCRLFLALSLGRLAELLTGQGELVEAQQLVEEAVGIASDLKDFPDVDQRFARHWLGWLHDTRGDVLYAQGRSFGATQAWNKAKRLGYFRRLQHVPGERSVHREGRKRRERPEQLEPSDTKAQDAPPDRN